MRYLLFFVVAIGMMLPGCFAHTPEVLSRPAVGKTYKRAKMRCVSRYYKPGARKTTCLRFLAKG
jgi:hypothetical protein